MVKTNGWILHRLETHEMQANFFIVGQIAEDDPGQIRAIADAGHEVASHGRDHFRNPAEAPQTFRPGREPETPH